MIKIHFNLPDDESTRLRKRAERHRRLAAMLSSTVDAATVLEEAMRADDEAKRLEHYVRNCY
jgi:hypothetical protein